jgi:hypothetical protein
MHATALDGLARNLGQGSTRRRFVRFLGGASATGVAAVGAGNAGAKRRKKKKKCRKVCNSEQRCVNGKCEWLDYGGD